MFSSGCCGRPRVLKRHSTRHRFEVLSRKKLIKRVLNLSEEPVRDKYPQYFRSYLLTSQRRLTYEQRLRLKADGRPCPKVTVKNRSSGSVYENFSWICADEEKNT